MRAATRPPLDAEEYRTIKIETAREPVYRDSFEAFGWSVHRRDARTRGVTSLWLRRPGTAPHRAQLDALQRRCEAAMAAVTRLERSRATVAARAAVGVGLVGTGFITASVFALLGGLGAASAALGVVGIALWCLPVLVRSRVRAWRTTRTEADVARQYDIVHDTRRQAAAFRAGATHA